MYNSQILKIVSIFCTQQLYTKKYYETHHRYSGYPVILLLKSDKIK